MCTALVRARDGCSRSSSKLRLQQVHIDALRCMLYHTLHIALVTHCNRRSECGRASPPLHRVCTAISCAAPIPSSPASLPPGDSSGLVCSLRRYVYICLSQIRLQSLGVVCDLTSCPRMPLHALCGAAAVAVARAACKPVCTCRCSALCSRI